MLKNLVTFKALFGINHSFEHSLGVIKKKNFCSCFLLITFPGKLYIKQFLFLIFKQFFKFFTLFCKLASAMPHHMPGLHYYWLCYADYCKHVPIGPTVASSDLDLYAEQSLCYIPQICVLLVVTLCTFIAPGKVYWCN